jgi:hypothetical protein
MKQAQGSYAMEEFPVPDGLEEVNVGGDLFGHGERYYLTHDQRGLLDQEVTAASQENHNNGSAQKSIVDRFFDIFR